MRNHGLGRSFFLQCAWFPKPDWEFRSTSGAVRRKDPVWPHVKVLVCLQPLILFCAAAKKSGKRTSTLMLHPFPFHPLNFNALSDRLDYRSMKRILLISRDLNPDSLREQVWSLSTLLLLDLGIYVGDAELSSVFHHTRSSTAGMISNYKNALQHLSYTGPERPNLHEPSLEHELIQFCLVQQRENSGNDF
jgi:hypothetical protein